MAQRILIEDITKCNIDLLTQQLRAIAPNDCYGVSAECNSETGALIHLWLEVSDTIAAPVVTQLKAACAAHDPTAKTPEQQAEVTGKLAADDVLAKADKTISDITTKLAAFQAAQNLANAAPLLIELAQDVLILAKYTKYLARKN